ncbi:MAG: 2-amino-4-hydroxy-6-hydroxymethyldihydropteridine diphosphokinase [Gammaproteobacteria bacterium]|nr:MAG: 2-amino-4-hydroxy-6-hydroxymethyldihydropteridine diphosphokinase [Gammaproteobacteria bacterium]
MTELVYIGLGSNLAAPLDQLQRASLALGNLPDTTLTALSSWYRTPPMGPQDQPDYINGVAQLRTDLSPTTLLQRLQTIENDHRRVRERHWGPRTLDLDILLYGNQVIDLPELQIPHPGMYLRNFVLWPLAEIDPQLQFPDGSSLAMRLENCPSEGIVRLSPGDICGTTG